MRTSFDHFMDNWDRAIHSYTTARETTDVANQRYLDDQTAEHDRVLGIARFQARQKEIATSVGRLKEQQALELKQNEAALRITKLFRNKQKFRKVVLPAMQEYKRTGHV